MFFPMFKKLGSTEIYKANINKPKERNRQQYNTSRGL